MMVASQKKDGSRLKRVNACWCSWTGQREVQIVPACANWCRSGLLCSALAAPGLRVGVGVGLERELELGGLGRDLDWALDLDLEFGASLWALGGGTVTAEEARLVGAVRWTL